MGVPQALDRKYPNAGREWMWHWVFPAKRHHVERTTGEVRRHHLHETVWVQIFSGGVKSCEFGGFEEFIEGKRGSFGEANLARKEQR